MFICSGKGWFYTYVSPLILASIFLGILGLTIQASINAPVPCKTTFEQVTVGMKYEQVVKVVGGPPGNYNTVKVIYFSGFVTHGTFERWVSNDAEMVIEFDSTGRVELVSVNKVIGGPEKSKGSGLVDSY